MKCETCKHWTRMHTSTPWFPPSSGTCEIAMPPWLINHLDQNAPPYIDTTTQEDDTCSFYTVKDNPDV